MAWALSDIRTRWRAHTGRSSVNDIADATVNGRINDFMQMHLPFEVNFPSLEADWIQETSPTDSGEYAIAETDIDLNEPIIANGNELVLYNDKEEFFRNHPIYENEDFVTPPTLVIGSGSAAKVKNSAFKYRIGDWTYASATAETALSGSTVPQNKYGAWLIEIDSAGTITVTGADDNATGYATAALAVNGLPAGSATKAIMGFVTAMNTASGGFIPGTTLLSAATVTDTYTDGDPGLRNIPSEVCVTGGKLYVRPKANDVFLIRAHQSLSRPASLSSDASVPVDAVLGAFIAIGSAIEYLAEIGENERVVELTGTPAAPAPGTYLYLKAIVNRKILKQQSNRESQRSF